MRPIAAFTLAGLSAVLAASASAQQPQVDMAAVQRWSQAKVAQYRVVGVYDGWAGASDWAQKQDRESGQIHATDTVTLEFKWDMKKKQPVGAVKIENAKTSVKGTRNTMDKRIAPVLKGDYEHLDVASVTIDRDGRGTLKGTRFYPAAELALDYPGSMAMKPVKAETIEVTQYIAVPDPTMMGMAGMMPAMTTSTGTQMSFTPDKKSFVMKLDGWTWNYTPTVVE